MSDILWTSADAALATGGETSGSWSAARVVIDSRIVQPGDLFIAIQGENFDGHDFVEQALQKGAVAAVVSLNAECQVLDANKLLFVPSTQNALEDLGRFSRARTPARMIGLTGSVGKTSTKEMLKLMLSAHGNTFASHGNFNNHIGTPLNLANLPLKAEFAVLEMGMNHSGEIRALTQLVQPHIAIITNVEAVHLEFFKDVEAIADAKAEIFEGIVKEGTAILNADSLYFDRCAAVARKCGARIIAFGQKESADVRLLQCGLQKEGMSMVLSVNGQPVSMQMQAIGKHWAYAAMVALSVAHVLALDLVASAQAMEAFKEPKGRGAMVEISVADGKATLMDDSYNASPASMRAAFSKVALLQGYARKLAALGDMLELGKAEPQWHAQLAQDVVNAGFDAVFTAGELMENLFNALPEALQGACARDAQSLLPVLQKNIRAGDLLLVKGSHGSKMYEIAQAIQTGEIR